MVEEYCALGVFYNPHKKYCNYFFEHFESMISSIQPTVYYIICLGDFNVDLFDINSAKCELVVNTVEGLGLKQ